ncbi:hypothetical protein MJ579_22305 [Klebsiella pneumoniae]|nr:hypothetical protein MJ579_22305 [Klebsiella pneumoniae]
MEPAAFAGAQHNVMQMGGDANNPAAAAVHIDKDGGEARLTGSNYGRSCRRQSAWLRPCG